MKCNVCGQEIGPGGGLSVWNMVTGFQAEVHKGDCERKYARMGAWCRMGKHEECCAAPGRCACDCHKEKRKRG